MSADDTHGPHTDPGRGYCGRKTKNITDVWKHVTCVDCRAAARADEGKN